MLSESIQESINILQDVKAYLYWTADKRKAFCPVVRMIDGRQEHGIVVAHDGIYEPIVYHGSLFHSFEPTFEEREIVIPGIDKPIAAFVIQPNYAVPHFSLNEKRYIYADTMALIKDGWEVD